MKNEIFACAVFFCAVSAIVFLLYKYFSQAKLIARIRTERNLVLQHQKDDIDGLVRMVIEVMNAVATSGTSGDLINRKLHRLFTINKDRAESRRSLVNSIPSLANVYSPGFVDYLRRNYPELTDKEIIFCSLIALGASSICVSMVFGYEHHITFYNIRTRIRKKMNIPSSVEFETFLDGIVSELEDRMNS